MAKMVEKWPFLFVLDIFSIVKFGLKLPFLVKKYNLKIVWSETQPIVHEIWPRQLRAAET